MFRTASYAPHLGAALAAAFMMAAALAYSAGERSGARGSVVEASTQMTVGTVEAPSEAVVPSQDTSNRLSRWLGAQSERAHSEAVETVDLIEASPGEPSLESTGLPVVTSRPKLVVIMDDVGLDVAAAQALMALDIPLTLAILPYAEASVDIARQAVDADLDVFLHMPMEPVGLEDPGPYALTGALSEAELQARLAWGFSQVPGAVGFNNHMGSRMTADRRRMDQVFAALGSTQDQIFVDSLTHPRSQAVQAARAAGVRAYRRDVFLDHVPDEAAVRDQINRALALALQNGHAIAIGHPRPQTLAALSDLKLRAEAVGVELATVSTLIAPAEPAEPVQARAR